MPLEIQIPENLVKIKIGEKVVLELDLLELYYESAQSLEGQPKNLTSVNRMELLTEHLNQKFQLDLSWPQTTYLFKQMNSVVLELKKKGDDSLLESLSSME